MRLTSEDILFVRGSGDFGPDDSSTLVGGTVRRGVRAYQTLRKEDIR
jgi:hypothetical protein